MTITLRPLLTVASLAVAAVVLAACGTADAGTATADAPGVVAVDADDAVSLLAERDDLVVVDVRTPEEFAEGHLAGAELLDIYDPAFRDGVDGLDRDAAYLVYCRSGNRSGQAVALMEELGFTEVYDAGALDALAAAGAATDR
ncbi:MAG: rhodanese-like domain-containing protein [Nitriliruptoraceae bacterium]